MSASRPIDFQLKRYLVHVVIAVGILAMLLSALRLWLGNSNSLTQVLWAEDGVFPLCIHKADFFTCLTDPFAGYLLFMPRMLAGIVSLFPFSSWALVTNLLAALFAGIVSALAYWILRRAQTTQVISIIGGLIPVVVPIVGYEAIQALGSVYMPMLYLSVLAVIFGRSLNRWFVAILLLVTALTIPTTIVVVPIILVWLVRRSISSMTGIIWLAFVGIGLVAQWFTAAGAEKPRVVELGPDGLSTWADSVLPAFMTNMPGFGASSGDPSVFPAISQWSLGVVVILALIALSGILLWRGWNVDGQANLAPIAMLILAGLALSAVPAIFDGPGNRYFVVPVMLWTLAVLIALNPLLTRSGVWGNALVVVILAVLWVPLFPAGAFRSTPAPAWSDEVARVSASCTADPALSERIIFTPFWPPNWGDALSEPTHPNVSCLILYPMVNSNSN